MPPLLCSACHLHSALNLIQQCPRSYIVIIVYSRDDGNEPLRSTCTKRGTRVGTFNSLQIARFRLLLSFLLTRDTNWLVSFKAYAFEWFVPCLCRKLLVKLVRFANKNKYKCPKMYLMNFFQARIVIFTFESRDYYNFYSSLFRRVWSVLYAWNAPARAESL